MPNLPRGTSQMDQEDNSRSITVSIIAFCGFVLLLALALPFWSPAVLIWFESVTSPLADNSDPTSSPAPEPAPTVSTWSDAEIQAALMQCVHSVAPIDAVLDPIAPIRDGECGTPTPVLLKSLSQNKVAFDPPLVVNCTMVVALHRWLNEAVQPAAKEAFGSPVIRVIGSSYACRTAYNEPNARLSQHAFANAVDLPIFILANGRKIDVTHGWGPTKRDLAAAAKSSAVAKGSSGEPKAHSNKIASTDLVKVSASRAPKDDMKQAAGSSDHANSSDAKFLRLAVQGACNIFSTVLGPEANDVHRTHFHLDLQDRGSVNVCK
jgi:hypothetical protein